MIRNCPNLNYIALDNCGLEEVIIEYCPKLEHLQGYHNNLTELKLGNFPELQKIYVPFNRLEVLEIDACPKLDTLYCNNNELRKLPKLSQFPELKALHCYKNADLKALNCSNLTALEEVFAQECSISSSSFFGCSSLQKLDLAENKLKRVNVCDNHHLLWFSCRDNKLKELNIENNTDLAFLVISNNYFPPMDISKFSHLHNMHVLGLGLCLPDDDVGCEEKNRQRLIKYTNYNH